MKRLVPFGLATALLFTSSEVFAQTATTVVEGGDALYNLAIAYAGVVGTLVSALAGWALYRFTNIRIEANARAAIETFATNAAGAFLAANKDRFKVADLNVGNQQIASLANSALTRIPDALKQFGMGPDQVRQRIVEKIGVISAPNTSTPASPSAPA